MAGRSRRPPKFSQIEPLIENNVPIPIPQHVDRSALIKIADDQTIHVTPENIEVIAQLGRGAYGIVEKIRHINSQFEMAVKRIPASSQDQSRFLMDMDVLDRATPCMNIVKFYGALFWEGDLWIFMEIMDKSLDKFYKLAYEKYEQKKLLQNNSTSEEQSKDSKCPVIPEYVLGKISSSVVKALHYLHSIRIIHRDIKPSNILINRRGEVKLCDFGISGYLVNSIAQTYEAGCKPYMAPERINPDRSRTGYDIRSDVWSLGITIVEIAIGKFPYPPAANFFQQLKCVCTESPPRLPQSLYSSDFEDFIVQCLQKEFEKRPNYTTLLKHKFVYQNEDNDISEYVTNILEYELMTTSATNQVNH